MGGDGSGVSASRRKSREQTPELIWRDEGFESDEEEGEEEVVDEEQQAAALEIQAQMESWIADLGLFRRKVMADHEMFGVTNVEY